MGTTWTQTSSLPDWCAPVSIDELAHSETVGFLAVRLPDASDLTNGAEGSATRMTGGLPRDGRPRTTKLSVRILPIMGAYGTGVSASQGSQKPTMAAVAATKASGVPPRGRPV